MPTTLTNDLPYLRAEDHYHLIDGSHDVRMDVRYVDNKDRKEAQLEIRVGRLSPKGQRREMHATPRCA